MPRGRRPEGDVPLSNAERQARWRERRRSGQTPAAARPSPAIDRRPRPRRWHDAVSELLDLQASYAAWLEALPETLRDTATGEALRAIAGLDLGELAAIEPPRGYGRD